MAMVKKSITVTDQQDAWLKAQISAGHYGNESEVLRELIRERQLKEQEAQREVEWIRARLIEGEESVATQGYSGKSLDEIWEVAKEEYNAKRNAKPSKG
ncbi:type II toxin-antitoxin system ParD family antitoxin [uncultured Thalassolituus sp.]|uniref:type II toxin-antitoxin system ParD family antitoxin n=1 Tax=uncultured Thalassolituus sp. TaxID=285273 RepID=UPI0026196162|nr:type II toxin-antitoxin system ParD family antitoxin [uncultured Thalassolituus sp.]